MKVPIAGEGIEEPIEYEHGEPSNEQDFLTDVTDTLKSLADQVRETTGNCKRWFAMAWGYKVN